MTESATGFFKNGVALSSAGRNEALHLGGGKKGFYTENDVLVLLCPSIKLRHFKLDIKLLKKITLQTLWLIYISFILSNIFSKKTEVTLRGACEY